MTTIYTYARFAKSELNINVRDVIENIADEEVDFEVDNYRFIHADSIDEIQQEELSSDAYILGCFNADFLAGVTGWQQGLIEAAQKGEAFEELGQTLIDANMVEAIQQDYSSYDGYGHHFARYDGNEIQCGEYYIFRVN